MVVRLATGTFSGLESSLRALATSGDLLRQSLPDVVAEGITHLADPPTVGEFERAAMSHTTSQQERLAKLIEAIELEVRDGPTLGVAVGISSMKGQHDASDGDRRMLGARVHRRAPEACRRVRIGDEGRDRANAPELHRRIVASRGTRGNCAVVR